MYGGKIVSFLVTEEQEGQRVEQILRSCLQLSEHQIRSAKYRPEGICANGKRIRVSEKAVRGDLLTVQLEVANCRERVEPVPGALDILYEDEDVIALSKPPRLVVHPAHGHYSDTLANYLAYYLQLRGGSMCVRAVGRLDKETSGVMLFAKNRVAAARLQEADSVQKEYYAIVHGRMEKKNGSIELPIRRSPCELNLMEVSEKGYFARTHYQVLAEGKTGSLLRLRLDTGRTHQIRVHMASIGHPLFGDSLYGQAEDQMTRTALHCLRVHFRQPFTGNWLIVEADMPEDMRETIRNAIYETGGER